MDEEIEHAMSIGQENRDFIGLGKAWCTHIRTDRDVFGVGLLEEGTGLPISGGRFTCDYAASQDWVAAMQLSVSALNFYENNCRGCQHRSRSDRIPNLGTWAEQRLTERAQQQEAEAAVREAERAQATRRADHRRLVAGRLSAECQDVVDLINRIDLDGADVKAAESLLTLTKLNPEAFPDEIKQVLLLNARTLQSSSLLGALVQLSASGAGDTPELRSLCIDAVREGWARDEGCSHLSRYGAVEDIGDRLLDAVVSHAAPPGGVLLQQPGDPTTLVHFHSLAPTPVEAKLAEMLRHGDAWKRASAAAGLRAVLGTDSGAGPRLLPSLLDGLRHYQDRHDYSEATHEVESAVAAVIHDAPSVVAEAVHSRWPGATAEYRARMMACFGVAIRHTSAELPADVARVILRQAVEVLSEPYNHSVGGYQVDYQGRATDVLNQIVRVAPAEVLSSDVLLGLLLKWLENEQEFSGVQLFGPLAPLERVSLSAQLRHYIRDITDSVVAAGNRTPDRFVSVCKELYEGADSSPGVRAEAVRMAGRVAAQSLSVANAALPLIYKAMLGEDQLIRASGMEAAGKLMRALSSESVPPLLAAATAAGLSDQYFIVGDAAVEAMRDIPVDLIDRRRVAEDLINIAWTYAPDRIRDYMVRAAIYASRRLAREDQEMLGAVRSAVLRIIERMPATAARETLCSQRWLEEHPGWIDSAIQALRLDDDLRFESPDDRNRDGLLERLGRRRLGDQQFEALAEVQLEMSRRDRWWSLVAADVFGELGQPELGANMVAAHRDTVLDTIEKRDLRRFLDLVQLAFETEAAIAAADRDKRGEISDRLDRWQDSQ